MKTILSVLALMFMSLSSIAGVSDEQMQDMMKQAEVAQQCFEKIDKSQFQQMQIEVNQMQSELKALCNAGKRSEAMNAAMKYQKKYDNNSEIEQMKKCADMMKGMMANIPAMPGLNIPSEADTEKHICDVL